MKKQKAKKEQVKGQKVQDKKPEQTGDSKFDFGGLPTRDLKKNLGCG